VEIEIPATHVAHLRTTARGPHDRGGTTPGEAGLNDTIAHTGRPAAPQRVGLLIMIRNELVRHGVISILRDVDPIGEVWACTTGREAFALLEEHRPGVVLCTGSNEFTPQIVARVAQYGGRVLLLLDDHDPYAVDEQAMLGAHGFLLQSETTAERLRSAVSRLAAGETSIPTRLARPLLARWLAGSAVTQREHEIMALFGRGLSTDRIARRLAISEHGVKRQVTSLLGKLDTDAAAGAVAESVQDTERGDKPPRSIARHVVISRPGSVTPRDASGGRRNQHGAALTGADRHARRAARAARRAAILGLSQPPVPIVE
jgi:two-component system, NarL family, nitrate/nitrite response regulator NarL